MASAKGLALSNESVTRAIIECATDAIVTIDDRSTVLSANDSVDRIFGYSPQDLIGQSLTVLMPPELRARHLAAMARFQASGAKSFPWQAVRLPGLRKDGKAIELEISFGQFTDDGSRRFVGIIRDVSEHVSAERKMREGEARYRDLFENSPLGHHSLGPDRQFIAVNTAFLDLLGYSKEELIERKSLPDLLSPSDVERFDRHWEVLKRGGAVDNVPYTIVRKDGSTRNVLISATAARDDAGRIVSTRGTMLDVTQLRRAEESVRRISERYRSLVDHNLAGVYFTRADGSVFDCNDAFAQILEFESREELLASSPSDFYVHATDRDALLARLQTERFVTGIESTFRTRSGASKWVLQNLAWMSRPGEEPRIEASVFDITARKMAEDRLNYQARHDSLTGLPNTATFEERVRHSIEAARNTHRHTAVLYLDLDGFKLINDTLGHHIGNDLLQLIAYRLQSAIRQEDMVARLGGDEFTIVAPALRSAEDAARIAEKISRVFAEPFLLTGREISVTVSIGIAVSPADGEDPETLLRNADIAMYRAKELGRNTFVFCSKSGSRRAMERMSLESDLRGALGRNELQLHFQPQIEAGTGSVIAVEALLRWQHPSRGLILPTEFISIAEESRLIVPIGEWVLREACRQAAKWNRSAAPLRVSVNLSPRQFSDERFVQIIEEVLRETALRPDLLELEITEGAAMQNPEEALETLRALKRIGVRISIDDFGTGYSALTYLSRFPLDALKIDQSFVQEIGEGRPNSPIISAVIALAHQLSLSVVAEGVETEQQSVFLRDAKCEHLQGFFFAHPLPPDELEPLLASRIIV
ncbi:MAG TPA: EAL domain-containing protein [Thermoanaerobaculia bacterium]|nr:EAL domain-containing protein [Thermoanaerobaculia bacterium]